MLLVQSCFVHHVCFAVLRGGLLDLLRLSVDAAGEAICRTLEADALLSVHLWVVATELWKYLLKQKKAVIAAVFMLRFACCLRLNGHESICVYCGIA